MDKSHFQKIAQAIRDAQTGGPVKQSDVLTGFSGGKLVGVLQRLARLTQSPETVYLEVGVFQGLTLLSVANAVEEDVYGIDNFAFFDPDGKNYGIVEARRQKLNLTNAKLINEDYEDALLKLSDHIGNKKVGVYFIDGPHDYRSQLVCLLFALPHLADNAVILIDDCNYRHVRQANADFLISHPEYKMIFEAYTERHPYNMEGTQLEEAKSGWWDGVNIMVKDPDNLLEPMLPPTFRNRDHYENEHTIHSMRYPEASLWGCHLAESYAQFRIKKIMEYNWKYFKRYRRNPPENIPAFEKMNTYSSELSRFRLNGAIQ